MDFGRFLVSFFLTVPFAVALALWRKKQGPSKWQRKEAAALAAGRVVTARRIKVKFCRGDVEAPVGSPLRDYSYRTVYEYDVNGRTYKFKIEYYTDPPETTELWYEKGKPDKAKPMDYNPVTGKDAFLTFVPIIVMAIIYWTIPVITSLFTGG